jgi:hypothetical protein
MLLHDIAALGLGWTSRWLLRIFFVFFILPDLLLPVSAAQSGRCWD